MLKSWLVRLSENLVYPHIVFDRLPELGQFLLPGVASLLGFVTIALPQHPVGFTGPSLGLAYKRILSLDFSCFDEADSKMYT